MDDWEEVTEGLKMKKIVSLVLLVTMMAFVVSSAFATETQKECDICHSTGVYTCSGAICPSGSLCPNCLKISFGFQPKCSQCGGSGTQNLMGQKVTCSNCLGKGETILEFKSGVCETCYAPTVCYTCLGLHTFTCPYCQQESYEEFSYGKVMRDDPDSKIGNLYKVRRYVVETEKIIDNTSHLTIEIPVNDKTNITCSAIYCPIQELKILPGDEVILYAYLFDVDSKDSLPTFVVPRAELAE